MPTHLIASLLLLTVSLTAQVNKNLVVSPHYAGTGDTFVVCWFDYEEEYPAFVDVRMHYDFPPPGQWVTTPIVLTHDNPCRSFTAYKDVDKIVVSGATWFSEIQRDEWNPKDYLFLPKFH